MTVTITGSDLNIEKVAAVAREGGKRRAAP